MMIPFGYGGGIRKKEPMPKATNRDLKEAGVPVAVNTPDRDHREYPLTDEMFARLQNSFTYHAPGPDQGIRYDKLRAAAYQFARKVVMYTPPSREQSLALTAIEEAVMRANQAIALNE